MKTTIKTFAILLAVVLGMNACVQNLNTQPIDPNINQTFDQDAVFYKIYTSFVQTGQQGGGGDADIITDDEGYSGFYRTLCVLNEFPTDAGWWTWRNDAGCSDLLLLSWTATNPFVSKLYNRLNYGVTMCNHFLEKTEGMTDDKTVHQRAEIRFIRAVNYYHLLDMFGNVPFTVTVWGAGNPDQIKRADLYKWLVDEILNGHTEPMFGEKLTDTDKHGFVDDLYDKGGTTVYRATKPAAYMLAARLFLNAEIYTGTLSADGKSFTKGTAEWANAEKYAKMVIDAYPNLHKPFAQIFMGDNDVTSLDEMVFLASQDGQYIRSYAGSQYTIASCRNQKMNDCGSSDNNWGCWRCSPELVKVFFEGKTPAEIIALGKDADEYAMPAIAKDDRAMFCAKNVNPADGTDNVKDFKGDVPESGEGFDDCWGICKWTNRYSTEYDANMQPVDLENKPQHDSKYMDTDVPLMRTAEAVMTLAEAQFRQGNTGDALDNVNRIRERANAAAWNASDLTEENLLAEWLREFYHEGRRRIDLIRFGQFVGPDATMNWEGRGGQKSFDESGNWNAAKPIDMHYIIYPIPNSDKVANANLEQNPGY